MPGRARKGSKTAPPLRRRARVPPPRHGGRGRRELLTAGETTALGFRTAELERARRDLERIFRAAIAAVDPTGLTRRALAGHLPLIGAGRVIVVGAGKAAARMAAGCEIELGAERVRGLVIAAPGYEAPLASIAVCVGAHPVPDRRGADATAALCRLVAAATAEPVICLLSGGASSLLVEPAAPLTLEEKIAANRVLLASGADIAAVNTVRKHLSAVKGGGLLSRTRARPIFALVLSDVVGDDPGVIGSGPTVPDPTTFADALDVMRRYGVADKLPPAVRKRLEDGRRGEVRETVKPGDPEAFGAHTTVIGSNALALAGAEREAQRLGYETSIHPSPITGDTTAAARAWLEGIRACAGGRRYCAIAGGETTVAVRGAGSGGRNQEFALALVEPLAGAALAVLSAGTDGIDGPTDAAGAFADGATRAKARATGLDAAASLAANDAFGFFDRLGDLFRCGPTGTNVMDVKIAVGIPLNRRRP